MAKRKDEFRFRGVEPLKETFRGTLDILRLFPFPGTGLARDATMTRRRSRIRVIATGGYDFSDRWKNESSGWEIRSAAGMMKLSDARVHWMAAFGFPLSSRVPFFPQPSAFMILFRPGFRVNIIQAAARLILLLSLISFKGPVHACHVKLFFFHKGREMHFEKAHFSLLSFFFLTSQPVSIHYIFYVT